MVFPFSIIDYVRFLETFCPGLLMVCCAWFLSECLGFRVSVLVLYAWSGLGRQKCGIKSSKTCVCIFLLDILCFVRIVWCICLLFVVRDIFTELMFISSMSDFGNLSYGVVSPPHFSLNTLIFSLTVEPICCSSTLSCVTYWNTVAFVPSMSIFFGSMHDLAVFVLRRPWSPRRGRHAGVRWNCYSFFMYSSFLSSSTRQRWGHSMS